jgi:hypothetical protein
MAPVILLLIFIFGALLLVAGILGLVFAQTDLPTGAEICSDGIDNDDDGFVDEVNCMQAGPGTPLDPFFRP